MGVGGGTDICGPSSSALSGLHSVNVIVLRDVDNHNRRRAGDPWSTRKRGGALRFLFESYQVYSVVFFYMGS